MDKFVEIELAEIITKNPNIFKVLCGKSVPKDIKEYIIECCCSKELKQIKKPQKNISQKDITEYITGVY